MTEQEKSPSEKRAELEASIVQASPQHAQAIDAFKQGRHIFLTGVAGTGKSHLCRSIIEWCRLGKIPHLVAGTTGVSALILGGKTLHSTLRLKVEQPPLDVLLAKYNGHLQQFLRLGEDKRNVSSWQLRYVEHVGIGRVLGSGARPQRPLPPGAAVTEALPAGAGELGPVALVGDAGAGDRDLAAGGRSGVEQRVGLGVDARQEERRHRGDRVHRLARIGPRRQATQVGVDHLLVALDREQQGDVDVHAAARQLLDRGQPRGRAGNLDHHVRLAEPLPQVGGLGDGRLGVVGQVGCAFERDEPVAALALLVGRAQQPGGRADVVEREREEQLPQIVFPARGQLAQLAVVAVGVGDRLGEDGGIGRRAGDAVVADQPGEPAALQQVAGQGVQPDGDASLPEPPQVGIQGHGRSSAQPFSRELAGQRAKRGGRDRQRSHLDGLARPGQRLDVLVSP